MHAFSDSVRDGVFCSNGLAVLSFRAFLPKRCFRPELSLILAETAFPLEAYDPFFLAAVLIDTYSWWPDVLCRTPTIEKSFVRRQG